jgi:hypothetical protein
MIERHSELGQQVHAVVDGLRISIAQGVVPDDELVRRNDFNHTDRADRS